MKKIIGLLLGMLLFTGVQAQKVAYTLPFVQMNNSPHILCTINGVKCQLLYDTGAFFFTLDHSVDKEMNGSKTLNFQSGDFETIVEYSITDDVGEVLSDTCNGIIGISFFREYLVEIDYVLKEIKLHGFEALNNIDTSYSAIKTSHCQLGLLVDLSLNVDDKPVKGKFLIDTGSGRNITLLNHLKTSPNKAIQTQSINASYFEFNNSQIFKADASFNNKVYTGLVIDQITSKNKRSKEVNQFDGIIGNGFLKNFKIIFDFKNKMIYLKENSVKNFRTSFNSDGIRLKDHRRTRGGYVVCELVEHPDQRFKLNDLVTEINNKPVSNWNYQELDSIQNKVGTQITYKVKRGNEELEITTQVKAMLE